MVPLLFWFNKDPLWLFLPSLSLTVSVSSTSLSRVPVT
jgi:hypothetical protein